jgi:hypothetical protein
VIVLFLCEGAVVTNKILNHLQQFSYFLLCIGHSFGFVLGIWSSESASFCKIHAAFLSLERFLCLRFGLFLTDACRDRRRLVSIRQASDTRGSCVS